MFSKQIVLQRETERFTLTTYRKPLSEDGNSAALVIAKHTAAIRSRSLGSFRCDHFIVVGGIVVNHHHQSIIARTVGTAIRTIQCPVLVRISLGFDLDLVCLLLRLVAAFSKAACPQRVQPLPPLVVKAL